MGRRLLIEMSHQIGCLVLARVGIQAIGGGKLSRQDREGLRLGSAGQRLRTYQLVGGCSGLLLNLSFRRTQLGHIVKVKAPSESIVGRGGSGKGQVPHRTGRHHGCRLRGTEGRDWLILEQIA